MAGKMNSLKKMLPKDKVLNKILIGILIVIIVIILCSILKNSNALESFSSDRLKPDNGCVTFAMFYAEWCPHCQTAKPEIQKLEDLLNAKNSEINNIKVKVERINCEDEKELANKYNITGYPTFKLLTNNGVHEYEGGNQSNQFLEYLEQKL
jgi:thiol-disulfide isomerase/thioredoxin